MKLHANDRPLSHYIDVHWEANLPPEMDYPPHWIEIDEERGCALAYAVPRLGDTSHPSVAVTGKFTLSLREDAPVHVREEFELRRAADAGDIGSVLRVREMAEDRALAQALVPPEWRREELALFEAVSRGELTPIEACEKLDSSPYAIERRMAKLR